jgi:hypothetical protein
LRQKLAVLSETEPTLAAPPARIRLTAQSRCNALARAMQRAPPAICGGSRRLQSSCERGMAEVGVESIDPSSSAGRIGGGAGRAS